MQTGILLIVWLLGFWPSVAITNWLWQITTGSFFLSSGDGKFAIGIIWILFGAALANTYYRERTRGN